MGARPQAHPRRFVLVLVLAALLAAWFIATRARGPAEAAVDASSTTDPKRRGPPAQANAADGEPRTLIVSVVDQAKQPIQGARVCLLVAGSEPSAQSCALTDSGGFVDGFELPSDERWRVATSAEGFQPSVAPRAGELRPSGDRLRVTLRRGGVRLTGVVEDATGGTIEGALVSVEDGLGLGVAAAWSGDAGEFELWASPGHVEIQAVAGGYVEARERLVLPSGPVRLLLLPESVIAGRVLEANSGEPIADAIVIARRTDDDGRTPLDDAMSSTHSDEDGRYELRGLAAGVFGLSSRGPQGFGTSEGGVVVEFASRVDDVDILVHRGTGLRIRVVIAETKQGCPNALVSLLEENTGHGLTATTDEDGRVELSVPVAGFYRADAACPGHRVVGEAPTLELSGDLNASETLEIALERGLVTQGIVVSEAERTPIADAVVALIPLHGRAPAAVAVADLDGRVALSGLEPGEYVATGSAPGWFPGDGTVTVLVPSDASFGSDGDHRWLSDHRTTLRRYRARRHDHRYCRRQRRWADHHGVRVRRTRPAPARRGRSRTMLAPNDGDRRSL